MSENMVEVRLRLFGLGDKDASRHHATRPVEPGTTVGMLWEALRSDSALGDRVATMKQEGLLVLVNGRPIRFLAGWETQVADGDTVSYMPKAFGG